MFTPTRLDYKNYGQREGSILCYCSTKKLAKIITTNLNIKNTNSKIFYSMGGY